MNDYLIDTSVLMRIANPADANSQISADAIMKLHRQNTNVVITAQVFIEFRNSATRPIIANGLGLSPTTVAGQIKAFEEIFPIVPESADIYPAWKNLVGKADVIGKQVHDARLVAICQLNNISRILTFNVQHFTRFIPFVPGLAIVDPRTI